MTQTNARKDYLALQRKLARGMLIQDAAAEAGMTLEDAQSFLLGRTKEDDESLRSFADEALRTGLAVLKKAAKEDEARTAGEGFGEGRYTSYAATLDVDAAKALLKAGLDARKMLRRSERDRLQRQTSTQVGGDLFDSLWVFKKTE